MGIYLCENKEHIYDIATEDQGMVFLIIAVMYVVFEIVFIWQSIILFRTQKQIMQTPTLIIFYLSMHILFIRTLFYALGGVAICYTKEWYALLTDYLFIFKRAISFIIVYRISVTCKYLEEFYYSGNSSCEKAVIVWGCMDSFSAICIYMLKIVTILPDYTFWLQMPSY